MTQLCKDIGEVWSRLFDHRPFLNGEIKFMLKEFEEKRSDREVENLFSILETVTDIKDIKLQKIGTLAKESLPLFNEKLEKALALCQQIEDQSASNKVSVQEHLQNRRLLRKNEWDEFMKDMTFKCKSTEDDFEEKTEELLKFYANLDYEHKHQKVID